MSGCSGFMYGSCVCAIYSAHNKHQWCSGNINAFQEFALGSIPGWCNKFCTFHSSFLHISNKYSFCHTHYKQPSFIQNFPLCLCTHHTNLTILCQHHLINSWQSLSPYYLSRFLSSYHTFIYTCQILHMFIQDFNTIFIS